MNIALDIALADIGAWGLASIGAMTFIAHRAVDRARLAAPPRTPAQAQPKDEPAGAEVRNIAAGGKAS